MVKGNLPFRVTTVLISIVLAACAGARVPNNLLTGPAPSKVVQETGTPSPPIPQETAGQPDRQPTAPPERSDQPENQAITDLADRLNVPASTIQVLEVEAVEWRDGSLGCAKPDRTYTQAIIPGLRILLKAGDQVYEYHSGAGGRPILCESDGGPVPPTFRATPVDIKDGVPWIPVK